MRPGRRAEWAKVQGRFEDVAFEERTEQLLRLLSHAIHTGGTDAERKPVQKQANGLASKSRRPMCESGLWAGRSCGMPRGLLPAAPPDRARPGPALPAARPERAVAVRVPRLVGALRVPGVPAVTRSEGKSARPTGSTGSTTTSWRRWARAVRPPPGKLWAEVQSALERLHDAPPLEVRLAKSIGLLQALGPTSPVPASRSDARSLALPRSRLGPRNRRRAETTCRRSRSRFLRQHPAATPSGKAATSTSTTGSTKLAVRSSATGPWPHS